MPAQQDSPELINNMQNHHFEMNFDGRVAFIDYKQNSDVLTLNHTEVPNELQGNGFGKQLVEGALQYIDENHLKLIPLCPFVFGYLRRHPQWKRLMAQS